MPSFHSAQSGRGGHAASRIPVPVAAASRGGLDQAAEQRGVARAGPPASRRATARRPRTRGPAPPRPRSRRRAPTRPRAARAEPVDRLVVEGVDLAPAVRPISAGQPAAARRSSTPWVVSVRRRALAVVERRAGAVGQVLVEVAAAGDVQHLGAAADGEHGQPARVGAARQLQLEAVEVAARPGPARGGARRRRRPGRCPGRPRGRARQPVEQRLDGVEVQRRHHDRQPAGGLDRAQVLQARAPSRARGGSPCGVWSRGPASRTSEVVTPISGLMRITHVSLPPPFCELFTTSSPAVERHPWSGRRVSRPTHRPPRRRTGAGPRGGARAGRRRRWDGCDSAMVSCAIRSPAPRAPRARSRARSSALACGTITHARSRRSRARLDHQLAQPAERAPRAPRARRGRRWAPTAAAAPRRGRSAPSPPRRRARACRRPAPAPNALTTRSVPRRTGSSSTSAIQVARAVVVAQPVLVRAPVEHVDPRVPARPRRACSRPPRDSRSSGVTTRDVRAPRASARCSNQALLPGPSESTTTRGSSTPSGAAAAQRGAEPSQRRAPSAAVGGAGPRQLGPRRRGRRCT